MKCLDKKRIKMKRGEALSLNERHMLQMVSSRWDYLFSTRRNWYVFVEFLYLDRKICPDDLLRLVFMNIDLHPTTLIVMSLNFLLSKTMLA